MSLQEVTYVTTNKLNFLNSLACLTLLTVRLFDVVEYVQRTTQEANMPNNRFLLRVRLSDGSEFTKQFSVYEHMKDFIKARAFFFITADYTTYDLAIQLKERIS
jgi:hypothetical protein